VFTISLDHNIVHYFVRGFPRQGKLSEVAERQALATALSMQAKLRFVVSDWNLVEPCRESHQTLGKSWLAARYADFLESLQPLFSPTLLAIKQEEMKACVHSRLGFQTSATSIVFNEWFSQARVASGIEDVLLGYGLRDFMTYLIKRPGELNQYRRAERLVLDAQRTIQNAKKNGTYASAAFQSKLRHAWFGSLLPLRGADGRVLSPTYLESELAAFVANPQLVFSRCPAIAAESVLSDVRANVGARRPQMPDAIDLMHTVPALAYCDAFISNDGFVRECATRTLSTTGRAVIVGNSLAKVIELLN
jgi:hypothetical protein